MINDILGTRVETVHRRPAFFLLAEHPDVELAHQWIIQATDTDEIAVAFQATDECISIRWHAITPDVETARAWMADAQTGAWKKGGAV